MKAGNKLAIRGQLIEVSSPSSVFPQCNIADITLHTKGKKKTHNAKTHKYFPQSQWHSSFKMFGQLLQKEKSTPLPKAGIFTCKHSGGDRTPPCVLRMGTIFTWDTPTRTPDATSTWDGHKLQMGHPNAAELRIQRVLSSCHTTYATPQTTTRARASSQSSNQKMTGPVQTWKPLAKWVLRSSSSSCHLIVSPLGAPSPQPPHTIISWQKDVTCFHSSLPASLFKAFWLLVRKWVCLTLPFSPSPCCLWGPVRKCFSCSYTSTASISWGPYGKKKGCLPSPAFFFFLMIALSDKSTKQEWSCKAVTNTQRYLNSSSETEIMLIAFTHRRAKPEQQPRDQQSLSTKKRIITLTCHQ